MGSSPSDVSGSARMSLDEVFNDPVRTVRDGCVAADAPVSSDAAKVVVVAKAKGDGGERDATIEALEGLFVLLVGHPSLSPSSNSGGMRVPTRRATSEQRHRGYSLGTPRDNSEAGSPQA
jgi:hypothetical protein